MQTLTFDELLRSFKQNSDTPHSLLLGAGASVESGVRSASDCVGEWKREIFLSQNPTFADSYSNIKVDSVREAIQRWLDSKGGFPKSGSDEEYSFYAERTYPIADDRRKYFQHLISGINPSIGYHLIAMLAEKGIIKSVWTTNFDGLMLKAAHKYNLNPIEITSETSDRIYRGDIDGELLCIALHGDYKYGALKNTASELDSQNDEFIRALTHELTDRDLIVIGYSGRDASLMSALQCAYRAKGSGKLFWCGYGNDAPASVCDLISSANDNGRIAFYIPTDGFDKMLYSLARHCMLDDVDFLRRFDALKKELGASLTETFSKFEIAVPTINKITDTNSFPISFPANCYQFEVKYAADEKPWDFCKLLSEKGIMAVPLHGLLYAWGEKTQIQAMCSSRIKSEISLTPFTRDSVMRNGAFNELLLKTVTAIIGQSNDLPFSKDKVWDTTQKMTRRIGSQSISAYIGVRFSLLFDTKYSYITITPTFSYENSDTYSREERKQFADVFTAEVNGGKPNSKVHDYVGKWRDKLFGTIGIESVFPLNTNTNFTFKIRPRSVILGVDTGTRYSPQLPKTIDARRIVLKGKDVRDTDLVFYNPTQKHNATDFHPMRGLINNAPFDYSLNDNVLRSKISLGVICPLDHNQTFYNFLNQLNNRQNVKYNLEYVIPFRGFYEAYKTNLDIPNSSENRWLSEKIFKTDNIHTAAIQLGQALCQSLDRLSAASVDVVLIYIPKEYEPLTGYVEGNEKFDLHDYVKAYAAQKNIATQFVREKTIESDMICQIMWALSLAIYVKSSRIPWVVSGINNDTAFAGIGYSINQTDSGSNIVVGCSHIYSSDGQGMKYKLSKIDDCTFDRKKNPYLSEDEAYRLGLNIKELFYRSFSEIPKRVVIHKRTPFRREEIKGFVDSLSSAGIKDIDLLEITLEDDLKCFEYNRAMDAIDGFPVRRGLCFPLNDNTMFLYTHGIAPSVSNPSHRYIQGGKTIPQPLKIVKHHGNGTISQIATEILGLSKMNWNSFGLYSKLPCTIASSNEIARIGRLLSQYDGVVYDYRFFM
jgi:NAD-dependent SIR2 family protein deacetylase